MSQTGSDLRQNVTMEKDSRLETASQDATTPAADCEQTATTSSTRHQKRRADDTGPRDHAPPGHDSSRDCHAKSRSPGLQSISSPLTPHNNSAPSTMTHRHQSHGRPRHTFADSSNPPVFTSSTAPTAPAPSPLPIAPTPQALPENSGAHRPAPVPPRDLSPTQLRTGGSHVGEPLPGSERHERHERHERLQPQRYSGMERQPETRPISVTQLVNEVKGIYVGLVMVESKCIEIDSEQGMGGKNNVLTDEQWQALITLHRTLLHEHHDFMLASQHPSASPALRRLGQKYAMPARMWRHGIHSFLELLRHRLPRSLEHMVAFVYLAYNMMALMYETVPAFEDTWVECLGDLSRYRMAIEDDNQRVRDTWTAVSRQWYTVASDKAPTTGRLYHHLAILARPHVITQMYYYVKSLCVLIPFTSTRESVMTLFDPILDGMAPRVPPIELDFTKIHAILFTGKQNTQFTPTLRKFLDALDVHIATTAKAWIAPGARIAIVNSCGLLKYGADDNVIVKLLRRPLTTDPNTASEDVSMTDAQVDAKAPAMSAEVQASDALGRAQLVATNTDEEVFGRIGDTNCYGYIHVRLVWMLAMARLPEAMALLERPFSWTVLVAALNHMMASYTTYERIEKETLMTIETESELDVEIAPNTEPNTKVKSEVKTGPDTTKPQIPPPPSGSNPNQPPIPPPPQPRPSDMKPLPEDWALRGLLWADDVFPRGWFDDVDTVDEGSRLVETTLTTHIRKERILWIAWKLAQRERWICYNAATHRFSVAPEFETVTAAWRRSRAVAAGAKRESVKADVDAEVDAEADTEEDTDEEPYVKQVWDDEDDVNLSEAEELARVHSQELDANTRVKLEDNDN